MFTKSNVFFGLFAWLTTLVSLNCANRLVIKRIPLYRLQKCTWTVVLHLHTTQMCAPSLILALKTCRISRSYTILHSYFIQVSQHLFHPKQYDRATPLFVLILRILRLTTHEVNTTNAMDFVLWTWTDSIKKEQMFVHHTGCMVPTSPRSNQLGIMLSNALPRDSESKGCFPLGEILLLESTLLCSNWKVSH